MGQALEIAKVLVSPTMKLLDMVGGAIGTVYEPRHKRKMADATAYEINAIGEAMRNAADMPIVYNQDGVAINSEDFNRLMQRAGTRLVLQETIKQHNIESVVDNAYEILEKEKVCSEEPVEQGWINRFFDSVADVSDEDLQKLWGKVLAGEIRQPKSYSLRTLETLKNLSKYEAHLFERLASLIAIFNGDLFVTSKTELLRKYGIAYEDILCLDECGLINSDGMVSFNPKISSNTSMALYNKSQIMIIDGINSFESKISFGIFGLTQAGKELYSFLDFAPNENYFSDFAQQIEETNKGKVHITLHKVNSIDVTGINYEKAILCEYPIKNIRQKEEK